VVTAVALEARFLIGGFRLAAGIAVLACGPRERLRRSAVRVSRCDRRPARATALAGAVAGTHRHPHLARVGCRVPKKGRSAMDAVTTAPGRTVEGAGTRPAEDGRAGASPGFDWNRSLWPPLTAREPTGWQPWLGRVERYLAGLLLAISAVITFCFGGHDGRWWAATGALVAATVLWLLGTVVLAPVRLRQHPAFALLTFAGVLGLGSVLEARDVTFLIFMIFAFLSAMQLRPVWLAFAALAVTSLLINTLGNGGPIHALADKPGIWLTIMVVQTAAIGGGGLLSTAVARQNEERRRMLDELAATQAENEGLQRQLLSQAREAGVLDERQRLAQEIHDTLAQGFTGIITQLEAATLAGERPAEWRRHLDSAAALARENLTAARRSVRALHPEALDTATLPDALAGVAARWSERTGVTATVTTTGEPRRLHPEIEATLLRITQEALSNVDRHAAARRAGLTLSYMDDEVTLDVRDDGVGFAVEGTATEDGGFGLPGMRRRARRLAGTLHVESERGAGTAISVALPAVPLLPEAPA
jgi:signal transduction histidine kinase